MLFGSTALFATQTPKTAVVGCVNRLPDGTLQFGAVPSGDLFLLRGQTNLLEEHVNQLVRVFAETAPRSNDNNPLPTLIAGRVQILAKSCTSVLPSKQLDGVPGKVGEDSVAVPLTTTFTEDLATPGFQTEAARARGLQSPSFGLDSPAAPVHAEQVAQSEAAANLNAGAVERTEILPGSALGVGGSAANPETTPPGVERATHSPAKSVSPMRVTIDGNAAPKLSPPRVTIKVGQSVQWLNSSGTVQEVIANPARETHLSGAALPANAKPFDSGFLQHGHSFEHQFNVPGVYHYVCKVNNLTHPVQATGEVIVQR